MTSDSRRLRVSYPEVRLSLTGSVAPYAAVILASLLAFAWVAMPYAAWAQSGRTYRVAMLEPFSTEEGQSYREAFLSALRDLGYLEGRNLILDLRTSDRDGAQVPGLADELIALKPDVLVSDGNTVRVLRQKTTCIPIVLTGSTDPVGDDLALSLARPGMNVTGVANPLDELSTKHIQLMREILPRLARVGMLVDSSGDRCKIVEDAARQGSRSVGATFLPYPVTNRHVRTGRNLKTARALGLTIPQSLLQRATQVIE